MHNAASTRICWSVEQSVVQRFGVRVLVIAFLRATLDDRADATIVRLKCFTEGELIAMSKFVVSLIITLLFAVSPARAIDSLESGIPADIPKTEESPTNKETDEVLKHQLKDLVGSVHHFRNSIRSIVYEITRQNYVSIPEDVVGVMVMPTLPTIAFPGYLPPRRKYMDHFAQQSAVLFNMVIEEDSTISASQPPESNLQTELTTIKSDIAQMRNLIIPMEKELGRQPYDMAAIDRSVLAISDRVDSLCKVLHSVLKITEEDIKHPDNGAH